jgi:RNA polymerase sigma-70 factor (ECF subfamily)
MTFLAQRRQVPPIDDEIEVPDLRRNPEKEFTRDQEESRLTSAIQSLALEYRQVITLTLEGLSYAEIADVLGIGESNVGVRINRARQMLRKLLEVPTHERR